MFLASPNFRSEMRNSYLPLSLFIPRYLAPPLKVSNRSLEQNPRDLQRCSLGGLFPLFWLPDTLGRTNGRLVLLWTPGI